VSSQQGRTRRGGSALRVPDERTRSTAFANVISQHARLSTVKLRLVLVLGLLLVAACSRSAKHASRNESIETYAERVLPQSFKTQVGDLAVAEVKICIPVDAKSGQSVRAGDFTLVLPNHQRVTGTTGAISPIVRSGRLAPGACTQGFVNWKVSTDQHPMIVDQRTGATWKPNCPKTTTGTAPCRVVPERVSP
jgi:hypothetical protein